MGTRKRARVRLQRRQPGGRSSGCGRRPAGRRLARPLRHADQGWQRVCRALARAAFVDHGSGFARCRSGDCGRVPRGTPGAGLTRWRIPRPGTVHALPGGGRARRCPGPRLCPPPPGRGGCSTWNRGGGPGETLQGPTHEAGARTWGDQPPQRVRALPSSHAGRAGASPWRPGGPLPRSPHANGAGAGATTLGVPRGTGSVERRRPPSRSPRPRDRAPRLADASCHPAGRGGASAFRCARGGRVPRGTGAQPRPVSRRAG